MQGHGRPKKRKLRKWPTSGRVYLVRQYARDVLQKTNGEL